MTRIRSTTLIAAPVGVVWDRLADLADHVTWMADAERIEFLGGRRRGEGTRLEVATAVGPFRTRDVMEFTEWTEREAMGVRHVGLVRGEGRFTLAAEAGGTRLTWEEDLVFPWFLGGRLTAGPASRVLGRVWRANLARFRALVEGR